MLTAAMHDEIERASPLIQDGIVSTVLSFVGPGHWVYLALVSLKWLELYRRVCSQFEKKFYLNSHNDRWRLDYWPRSMARPFEISSTYTFFSATLGSSSRVELAHRYRCQLQHLSFLQAATKLADKHALLTARELGMPQCDAVVAAARRGDRDDVEWLLIHYHVGRCGARIVTAAAASGSVELMAWLHSVGTVIRAASISTAAAKSGNLALCLYLASINCPWSEDALHEAVAHRHADVFRWLQANSALYEHSYSVWRSVPPTSSILNVYEAAAAAADELEWLAEHSPLPSASELTQLLHNAGSARQLSAAQWYRQHGAEWPAVLSRGWGGEVFDWARAAGCDAPLAAPFVNVLMGMLQAASKVSRCKLIEA
jgi:hypothetical protein